MPGKCVPYTASIEYSFLLEQIRIIATSYAINVLFACISILNLKILKGILKTFLRKNLKIFPRNIEESNAAIADFHKSRKVGNRLCE